MSRNVAYLVDASGLNIFIDGSNFVIASDHPNFNKAKEAVAKGEFDKIPDLCDVRSSVRRWLSNDKDFALTSDCIVLNGLPFSLAVTDKVLTMIDAGHNAEPLFKFLRKVRLNPSNVAQGELLLFCVANDFMIHTDGDIIAYKGVRDDYKDIHSGTINNAVGQIITMERPAVDDRRENTCSHGLHFASHEYASTWAGATIRHLMIMKINPRDVVSIPNDYNNQKGRCCRYEVIAESKDFTPLPKREVYSDRDLGVGGPWDDECECECECESGDVAYEIGWQFGHDAIMRGQEYNDDYNGPNSKAYQDGYAIGWNDALEEKRV